VTFTDRSDLYGALNEEGINFAVQHVMQQRPSLFNYASADVAADPEQWCRPVKVTPDVERRGNPVFTIEDPLTIWGTDGRYGLDFCAQLTEAALDFHPGGAFPLPPELDPLPAQRFALHAKACTGIGCPPDEVLDRLDRLDRRGRLDRLGRRGQAGQGDRATYVEGMTDRDEKPRPPAEPLPHKGLECFCLEIFVVGHFETQGALGGSWLVPRLDGLEIVDIKPEGLENALECYLRLVIRLGIMPQLTTAIGKAVLGLLAGLPGIVVSAPVTPPAIPFNPAIEADSLKVYLDFAVGP
jgi:hypothetical protein